MKRRGPGEGDKKDIKGWITTCSCRNSVVKKCTGCGKRKQKEVYPCVRWPKHAAKNHERRGVTMAADTLDSFKRSPPKEKWGSNAKKEKTTESPSAARRA